MSLVSGTVLRIITGGSAMHNRDQFDQEMRRFEEREEMSGPVDMCLARP